MLFVIQSKSQKKLKKIYCFPGNAGTSNIATNIDLNINDFEKLKDFILEKKLN